MTSTTTAVTAIALPGVVYYLDPEDPTVVCNAPELAAGGYELPEAYDGTILRGGTDHGMCCPSIAAQDKLAFARLIGYTDHPDRAELAFQAIKAANDYRREAIKMGDTDLSLDAIDAPVTATFVQLDLSTMTIVEG